MKNIIELFKKYKVYFICGIIILLSIISLIMQYFDKKNSMKVNLNSKDVSNGKVAVYILGEVKNPGVYYLNTDARIYELLDVCGGVTDDADISKLNLAKKLVDSDMVTIPKKVEQSQEYDESDENESKVNINTASKEELMSLNGIGQQTADNIIEYRETMRFNDIEDLLNVTGVGKSKYENIKEDICVD